MGKVSKDRGKLAERRIAKKLGTDRTPYSGAGKEKGDVSHPQYIVEVKTTGQESLTLRREWLTKVAKEALAAGKEMVLIFRFVGDTRDYAIIPMDKVPGLMPEGADDDCNC